ncbi:hypothetical protein ACH9L7_04465 [Haloferax sp. S1W]|uniref:hypothetical protein n=1 Tax=Haloferax sp. S1W TaxID=3377110 RepID=UPI0037C969EB
MRRQNLAVVGLALAGFGAVAFGITQEALTVAPMYDGSITTGWGERLNHEERLLRQVSALGAIGAVGALWRRYLAVLPVVTGGIVLFYPLRAMLHWTERPGLYTEVPTHDGGVTKVVLGAEPFLLLAGGLLLVSAGVLGWRWQKDHDETDGSAPGHSSTM